MERIEEIAARASAATDGPWYAVADDAEVMCINMPKGSGRDFFCGETPQEIDDADFIAHAREDVPWLLERVVALSTRNAEAEAHMAAASWLLSAAEVFHNEWLERRDAWETHRAFLASPSVPREETR